MGFLYECHETGYYYISEFDKDFDDLYCEQCGDSDWLIGSFETERELWELLASDVDIDDMCAHDLQMILNDFFPELALGDPETNDISKEELIKIIEANFGCR